MTSAAPLPSAGEVQRSFARAMERLGPFEPAPRLAAAVSGGADSMALALLAREWVRSLGGCLVALVVDHRLRPESGAEAALIVERLHALGIPARLLPLRNLSPGSALAERARDERYRALREACAADGRLHLLLGHHARDQAETVLIRREGGSGPRGLAAMPALVELSELRLLRPLLGIVPGSLRALLQHAGIEWVEDPSNRDQRALRPRLRAGLSDPDGDSPRTTALWAEAQCAGRSRAAADAATADMLARGVAIYPEGFAHLTAAPAPDTLAALVQTIAGAAYPPASAAIAALAGNLRSATLSGVRIMRAGRFGAGWLLVREASAVAGPVQALPGTAWDGRFRLLRHAEPPAGAMVGALGADSGWLRRHSHLPAAVLQTLPAVRLGNVLVAVPHLSYPGPDACARFPFGFSPRRPLAGAPFLPA